VQTPKAHLLVRCLDEIAILGKVLQDTIGERRDSVARHSCCGMGRTRRAPVAPRMGSGRPSQSCLRPGEGLSRLQSALKSASVFAPVTSTLCERKMKKECVWRSAIMSVSPFEPGSP